jgi:hypothetical protein
MNQKLGNAFRLRFRRGSYLRFVVRFHLEKPLDRVSFHVIVDDGVMRWAKENKVSVRVPFFCRLCRIVPWTIRPRGTNVAHVTD